MILFRKITLFICCLFIFIGGINAKSITQAIFTKVKDSLYQIQLVNKITGKKTSFGSGFVVFNNNLLASNYHVIASYIDRPDEVDIEYLSVTGRTGKLTLLDIDVFNDLAILQADEDLGEPLSVNSVTFKGEKIYSLGNPLDLGFAIIEGINNDKLQHDDANRILYSASLNPGMSGGPAVNLNGEVVGVNVATSTRGKDISFLVHIDALSTLYQHLQTADYQIPNDFKDRIKTQLASIAEHYFKTLLNAEWTSFEIGDFRVVHKMGENFTCSDRSSNKKQFLFSESSVKCQNNRSIYISPTNQLGYIDYSYHLIKAKSPMLSTKFYNYYQHHYSIGGQFGYNEEEHANINCFSEFIKVKSRPFKATICEQPLKSFTGFGNFSLVMAEIGQKNKGFIFKLSISGLRLSDSLTLSKKMLSDFQ